MGSVTRAFSASAATILSCEAGLGLRTKIFSKYSFSGKEYNAQTHPDAFQSSP